MDLKEEFLNIARGAIQRDGIEDLLNFVEGTDFFTAPASTRYHGACEGGLLMHSLNVYVQLNKLCGWYDYHPTQESIAIVSLFHDLCKADCYKIEMRWRKNDKNQWEQYPTYKFEENFAYGGHGSKSVYLIQNFMKLEPFEASAINCHMGAWDISTYGNPSEVFERNKLAWLLHVADEAASYIVEKEEINE
jgi:hypothetical protein